MKYEHGKPPKNTLRVLAWRDLPDATTLASYAFTDSAGKEHGLTTSKKCRCVLEGLMQGPIYCAGVARVSSCVEILRNDHGLDIETRKYKAGEGLSDQSRFGVYFLRSEVSRQGGGV